MNELFIVIHYAPPLPVPSLSPPEFILIYINEKKHTTHLRAILYWFNEAMFVTILDLFSIYLLLKTFLLNVRISFRDYKTSSLPSIIRFICYFIGCN